MAKKQEMTIEQRLEEALVLYEKTPYNLPSNWCWVKLGNLTNIAAGGTPARNNSKYWENGNIPWVKISDLSGKYVETTEEKITKLGLDNSSAKIFKKGTILYSIFATIGEIAVLGIEAATNQAIAGISCLEPYNVDYMYYVLLVLKDLLVSKAKGVAQVNINQSILKETPIPLAPLEEQKRIVDIIERQFAKLDEARDLIQKSLDSFADRKSAILYKAFTGELTNSWREERHRSVTRQEVCIGDIAEINPKSEKIVCNDEEDVSFVPMKSVCEIKGEIKEVLFEKFKKVKKGFTFFKENDVLFAKITPCMENGKCFIATGLKNKFGFASTEFYVFRCGKSIHKRYLWYILRDKAFRNRAKQVMTGAVGQQRVPKAYLEKERIALFDLDEQEEIVRILDSIFEKEDKSKELIGMLDKIDEMKKSILARAFRGELGTSNTFDEPAIELLKRILENNKG